MLESQHSLVVKALQRLYKHCVNKEGFPGEPLVDVADGHPLTHAILDRLGLIKQAEEGTDEQSENNEEPLHSPRQLSTSTDYIGTVDPSPEPASPRESTTTEMGPQAIPIPCKWDLPAMFPEQHGAYPRYDYLGQVPHATTADRLYQPPVALSNTSRCPDESDQNDVCPYQGPTQPSIDALSNYQLPLGQQPSYLVDSIGLHSGWAYPAEQ
ncbi:C6 transcription factor, putative [Paecilomyces variotii No. 5]|uniref:C6 transcription factor, putative n=1 Tax=Byssochlamys spectabilis (strain No. 5 / NBRC 109023) TaxID=1356009 RepID=V5HWX6_BYSSN|nr:C6 transcription factor, putative [Paecilomyces variotii No. 5]